MLKKIFLLFGLSALALGSAFLSSCDNDDDSIYSRYKEWREFNQNWLIEQTTKTNPNGTAYYTNCAMPTDPTSYILMHSVGEIHTENLKPLYTSTTKVNYTLTLANDSVIDKGTNFVSQLNSQGYIKGWSLAIMQLHVGDSATFIIPYSLGYGESGSGTSVPPYSNLKFDIKLTDIVGYETRP